MKHLVFLTLLALPWLALADDLPPPIESSAPNPLADPFGANSKVTLPPVPQVMPSSIGLPLPPVPGNNSALPQNLRVLMIRENGQGLLGRAEAGSISIPASHGKKVLIGGQSYYAEVTRTEIRLYTSAKGMLVWEGSLAGVAPTMTQPDIAQATYVPPLSAGVNPGLGSRARSNTAAQPVINTINTTGLR